jgi:predicted nucleotidyltransferase
MFDPSFIEFLILLNKHKVEYLLIGGIAVNLYGYSRTTGDMDIWINPTNENGKKLVLAVDEFGYDITELAKKNFEETDVFFLGEPPFRIDILNKMQGLKFPSSFEKRKIVEHQEIKINLLSLEDLKVNKLLSGRHKDLDDLENLAKEIS